MRRNRSHGHDDEEMPGESHAREAVERARAEARCDEIGGVI